VDCAEVYPPRSRVPCESRPPSMTLLSSLGVRGDRHEATRLESGYAWGAISWLKLEKADKKGKFWWDWAVWCSSTAGDVWVGADHL